MRDCLGQEIHVGSRVLWGGGKTQYAGFRGGPKEVVRLTEKRARIRLRVVHGRSEEVSVAPRDLVVVDTILAAQQAQ